jgi:hypothetical protein
MAQRIRLKRGTRAQLAAAAAASGLTAGEPYLITDEGVLAVGTAAGAYADTGASAVWIGPSAPTSQVYRLWFDTSDPAVVSGGLCLYVRDPTTGQWLPSLADALLTQPAPVAFPASATAPGVRGSWAWNGTHFAFAVADNAWVQIAPESSF